MDDIVQRFNDTKAALDLIQDRLTDSLTAPELAREIADHRARLCGMWRLMTPRQREECRDLAGLSPQLVGLEGWRVEVVDDYGEAPERFPRRFIVGRSTGWRPCHLEIARRNSTGGRAAWMQYRSVRKLYKAK